VADVGQISLGVFLFVLGVGVTLLAIGFLVDRRQLGSGLTEIGYPIKELRLASVRALRLSSAVILFLMGISLIGYGVERF